MARMLLYQIYVLLIMYLACKGETSSDTDKNSANSAELLIITVATDSLNDGLRRLNKSADEFGLKVTVFGTEEQWNGGDMRNSAGGAQKVRILREGLSAYNAQSESLVLFVDAYDVIINADAQTIIRRFVEHFDDARIVFGAERFCWPDKTLASKYPLVTFGERFLNSGMFIGYLPNVMEMLQYGEHLKDNDDDQLFYTNLYLDSKIREKLKIGLDSLSRIFQNLNGMSDAVGVEFSDQDGNAQIYNTLYNTHPVVIHGNGPSKLQLNAFGNYIAHQYNRDNGCIPCKKLKEELNKNEKKDFSVAVAVFVTKPVPYIEEFFLYLLEQKYPKDRVHLLIYNNQRYNAKLVEQFVKENGRHYASVEIFNLNGPDGEHSVRNFALKWARDLAVDYLFLIDADGHLADSSTFVQLLTIASTMDVGILSPMIVQPKKFFSNFWGAISETGFYARSADYIYFVERERVGLWNVPFANTVLLIARDKLQIEFLNAFAYNRAIDADMSFAQFCRDKNHFIFVSNLAEYGYLVESDNFANLPEKYIHRELYDIPSNKLLWEKRYIHDEYFNVMEPNVDVPMACPDVYDFPLVSERFCQEIIEIMEHYGRWSDGSNVDKRLDGGYENVPTRDIHMKQVGLETQWLTVINDYVVPMQEKVFIGYYQKPVHSTMMFVVRYRPDEQPALRPHQDASTYSIDIALNKRGVDYEGGGVRYIRYNCTAPADQVGWSMMFPGRLTHMHEGLPTTQGTRYILVSFLNP